MGLVPARLHEGVTPTGGLTKGLAGEFAESMNALHNLTIGDSELAKLTKQINKINSSIGVFSNISQKVESSESTQAYTIGAKTMWSRLWKPNKGFKTMPPELETALRSIDPRLPEFIYATIKGNTSTKSIEAALWRSVADLNVEHALDQALSNIDPAHVDTIRQGLEHIGVIDEFKTLIKGATTPAEIDSAIKAIDFHVKELIELDDLQKAVAFGEELDNILKQEGIAAIPEMFVEMQQRTWDQWIQHYRELSEFIEYVDTITDSGQKASIWHDFLAHDSENWHRVQEHELQIYSAILSQKMPEGGSTLVDLIHDRIAAYSDVFEMRSQMYDDFYSLSDRSSKAWNEMQQKLSDAFTAATNTANSIQGQVDIVLAGMFGEENKATILASRKAIADIQVEMDAARLEFVKKVNAARTQKTEGGVRNLWATFQREVQMPLINKLKLAEMQFGSTIEPLEPKPGAPETLTAEQVAKNTEVINKNKAAVKQAQLNLDTILTRNEFRAQMKESFPNISKEQWSAIFRLTELRARRWAKENGKKPADWYTENMAAVTADLKKTGGLKQDGDWYYSQLEDVVKNLPQEKMSVEQLLAAIKKGSKVEEIEWSGIEYWLENKGYHTLVRDENGDYIYMSNGEYKVDTTLTKSKVLEYLNNNKTEVKVIRLNTTLYANKTNKLVDAHTRSNDLLNSISVSANEIVHALGYTPELLKHR
jgi:hypothetical protein